MKPLRLLLRICAILCGIALTWACATVGFARVWLTGCRGGGKYTAAKQHVQTVEQVLFQYRADENRWPTTADLVYKKYLSPRELVDPWGTVIVYRLSGDFPTVLSAGPDRTFDTEDDIKSPEPE
jgi:hypothetical protein